ncbi:hypothetical protein OIM38_18490, partial [Salmonella enterica subsp. enterica serovar Senftenberg]|nr:hypothetical protein [Salmonella enterica subsp. enterica serovar Senftenberg]
ITEQYDAGGISATQSFGRDLKKCLELKRVYLHNHQKDPPAVPSELRQRRAPGSSPGKTALRGTASDR